jgi:transposase
MNEKQRYTEEFKLEAIKQVTERGHAVADVATRLGVSSHSLYAWIKRYGDGSDTAQAKDHQEENKRLKAELRRVTEERDILKKAAAYFAKQSG